jgi:hypothetical protein
MQTIFRLSPYSIHSRRICLVLERGVHNPSPAVSLAPFHQDPAQRIIAFSIQYPPHYYILRVGGLFELLKGREGTEIGWDEWKHHVVIPSLCHAGPSRCVVEVSGCQFFNIFYSSTHCDPSRCVEMEVHDFSVQGRAKYLSKKQLRPCYEVDHLPSTGARVRIGPPGRCFGLRSGHGSIIFTLVSATICHFLLECY